MHYEIFAIQSCTMKGSLGHSVAVWVCDPHFPDRTRDMIFNKYEAEFIQFLQEKGFQVTK